MIEHIAAEALAAYVDGALESGQRPEVEAHLARCRECRVALVEVVGMLGSREKAPREFLRRALKTVPPRSDAVPAEGAMGRIKSPAWRSLILRPAFGIAAVFFVAVLIGYFYFGRGRVETERVAERKMPEQTVALEDRRPPAKADEAATPALDEGQIGKAQAKAANGLKTEKTLAAGKGDQGPLPAAPFDKKAEPAAELLRQDGLQSARPGAAAASDMTRSREREEGVVGGVEAPLEKDKANGTTLAASESAAAQPTVAPTRAKGPAMNEMKQYRFQPAGAAAGAMQLFLAATGRAAAPLAFRAETALPQWRVRIEGDVGPDDLLDPKQLGEGEWLPEGLFLELEVAADGTVAVVMPLGDWDASAVARAAAAAKKLVFSASARKTRRATLSARNDPN